jgi:hypothetical protein
MSHPEVRATDLWTVCAEALVIVLRRTFLVMVTSTTSPYFTIIVGLM